MNELNFTIMLLPIGLEWLLLIGIIVVVFFGIKRIPELAKSFGKATAEFEKARFESKNELERIKNYDDVGRQKLEEIAASLEIDYSDKNDDVLRTDIERALSKEK